MGSNEIYYQDDRLLIRDRTPADGPRFTAAEIAQGWHATTEKYEEHLRCREAGRAVLLTAEYRGSPAGYVNVYWGGPDGPLAGRGWAEIVDLGVLQAYQRQGIGEKLMDAAEAVAARCADTVFLSVGLHNGYGAAQRMYVKRGYIPDGSGVWYNGKPVTPYDTVYTNDDDLVLYLYKRLK